MQSKQDLEDWYNIPDQWGYFTNEEDTKRRDFILSMFEVGHYYQRTLDIGCGEGFITHKIPSNVIHGLDLSNKAMQRLPSNVIGVNEPSGKYDLVISTGTLYPQYDHQSIYNMIMASASQHILISGISDWLIEYNFGTIIKSINFNYREYTQKTTLYAINS